MSFRYGQRGDDVRRLQRALIFNGYELPKYGADGQLGSETWSAIESFSGNDHLLTSLPLPTSIVRDILEQEQPREDEPLIDKVLRAPPVSVVRVKGDTANIHGMRRWEMIDGIMLHQTGIWMNDTPDRFVHLKAHVGILRDHATPIVQVHPLNAYVMHGNEENRFTIGIEVNGHFPGLVSGFDPKRHTSEGPPLQQIIHCQEAIGWIISTVRKHGGKIQRILPHRVANDSRRSDPGEVIWKQVGVWAQDYFKLSGVGPGYCIGDGRPIPYEWVGREAYKGYRY